MQKVIKYVVFQTKWGYLGLAGTESALCRTCLPLSEPEKVKSELLTPDPRPLIPLFDKNLFKTLQKQITAYFDGTCVNFSTAIPVVLDGLTQFCCEVLTACREVKFGQVVTYSELAKKIGRPAASRAVGNALAKNPLPLIIPCHRIVRIDGSLGGFSAHGSKKLKKKLLNHELAALTCSKDCPDKPILRKFLL